MIAFLIFIIIYKINEYIYTFKEYIRGYMNLGDCFV